MSNHLVSFAGYSASMGGLLPGLTPVWTKYVNAVTGSPATGPTISALGTGGMYQTTINDDYCGMIELGGDGTPAYIFLESFNVPTYAAFDVYGLPLEGVVGDTTWDTIIDTATGLAPGVSPGFTDLGGGCYKLTSWVGTYAGVIDIVGGNPQQQQIGPTINPVPTATPIISDPTPASGTTIVASASIQFTLTDPSVTSFSDCLVEIIAEYPLGTVELIYSTAYGGFTPAYVLGSSAPAPSASLVIPRNFVVTRDGGWPAAPSLTVQVTNISGGSAEKVWSWQLAGATIQLNVSPPLGATQSPYGSDCRTFAPLPDGTMGVDPYFLLTQDPFIVMAESVARILLMPLGTLWYATGQGFDLRKMINSRTDGNFSGVQAAVIQAVNRDPRIKGSTCQIRPLGRGSYQVAVTAIGATGPFSCVFLLSSVQGITALSFT